MTIQSKIEALEVEIQKIPTQDLSFRIYDAEESQQNKIKKLIQQMIENYPPHEQQRILAEFEGFGPIENLLADDAITEILINGPKAIWFEKFGTLHRLDDSFSTSLSYSHFISRLCHQGQAHYNLERPMADGKFQDFRVHIVSDVLTKSDVAVSLRRHPKNPWSFSKLTEFSWATAEQVYLLKNIIQEQKNFLVIGSTGSGKTSVLNACLQELRQNERVVLIEDTQELALPNSASTRLLTRRDSQGVLPVIDQMELVKQALRMRPDRLVMGEIRGAEAKDLLMALSTGHSGSFATLHATDPQQALLRLEMLIQLGASFWSLEAIRSLIFLSLQNIIVVGRSPEGPRKLLGIYGLSSREASGILVDRMA